METECWSKLVLYVFLDQVLGLEKSGEYHFRTTILPPEDKIEAVTQNVLANSIKILWQNTIGFNDENIDSLVTCSFVPSSAEPLCGCISVCFMLYRSANVCYYK
jgi:hypothetical protein